MSLLRNAHSFTNLIQFTTSTTTFVRCGHHLRGKAPSVARSLKQRLDDITYSDPKVNFKVNIGFSHQKHSNPRCIDVLKANRRNEELEKMSRKRQLLINLELMRKQWLADGAPYHIKKIGEHYAVFNDLFGDAYFVPVLPLEILYNYTPEKRAPVYYGNYLKPAETAQKPDVVFASTNPSDYWTLTMTNPDGHFTETNKEYIHWFIGNIPGNQIDKGEEIVKYLQPIPPKGTGYHRHVFILYKQERKLDLSKWKRDGDCYTLSERTFSTYDFYKQHQDDLTPAGLSFFQADWDSTLTDFYHNKLHMREPVFEYDFPDVYVKPQTWFPLRQAFNLYMDRYRDPKQINKEFLMRKLQNVHVLKPPPPILRYPNAVPFEGYTPSWLRLEKTKSRLGWGRINDI